VDGDPPINLQSRPSAAQPPPGPSNSDSFRFAYGAIPVVSTHPKKPPSAIFLPLPRFATPQIIQADSFPPIHPRINEFCGRPARSSPRDSTNSLELDLCACCIGISSVVPYWLPIIVVCAMQQIPLAQSSHGQSRKLAPQNTGPQQGNESSERYEKEERVSVTTSSPHRDTMF
jgi:hypothetical protein